MRCINISAYFEFGGHSPHGAHPKNVALGYDVEKISVNCLIFCYFPIKIKKQYEKRNVVFCVCDDVHSAVLCEAVVARQRDAEYRDGGVWYGGEGQL